MTDEVSNTTLGIGRFSLFDRRRFSNASALTVSTVNTALPAYSTTDGSETPEDEVYSEIGIDASPTSERQSSLGLTSAISPPRYSYLNPRHSILLTWSPSSEDPQTESQSNGFRYSFPIKTWATLHLDTCDAIPGNPSPSASQPKVPRFWGCEPIAGVLGLDLDNPVSINEINIVVKGKITTSSLDGGSLPFLAYEHPLWKKSYGDPRQLDQSTRTKEKFSGKLIGKYSFPFSFPFPTEVNLLDKKVLPDLPNAHGISAFPYSPPGYSSTATLPESKGKRTSASTVTSGSSRPETILKNPPKKSPVHPPVLRQMESINVDGPVPSIPQTFFEKGVSASIVYELSIHLVHGRLKPTTKIKTNISYVPASQPLPASQKRKKAYEAGAHVPGPFSDPDGWYPMPTSTVHGTFNCDGRKRQTKINCTLYVALPLSYTRGTVIPCFFVLSSIDGEALESLSTSNIPSVGLMRRLHHFVPAGSEDERKQSIAWTYVGEGFSPPVFVPGTPKQAHIKTMLHEMGTATWWESDVRNEPNTRQLQGEIHLSSDLKPSCACKIFTVEYYVEMASLRSASFEPNSNRPISPRNRGRNSIATVPVEITTLCRPDEPVAIPFSRPPRVHVRRVSDVIPEGEEV